MRPLLKSANDFLKIILIINKIIIKYETSSYSIFPVKTVIYLPIMETKVVNPTTSNQIIPGKEKTRLLKSHPIVKKVIISKIENRNN